MNDELDRYLASEYGIDPTDTKSLASWRESHQPFHWLAEFYDIVQGGGFDVVVGNPPYIEIARARLPYSVSNFTSKDSGNLYCPMMERGVALTNSTAGRFGMIVPMSIVSTERMTSARDVLEDSCGKLWLSNFSGDANPSKLFEGVKFRLSIVLASMSEKEATWSSAYLKWFAAERDVLFQKLQYQSVGASQRYLGLIPKLGSPVVGSILNKLIRMKPLARFQQRSNICSSRSDYVRKVFRFRPVLLE